jgi:hypothetical protein
MSEENDNSAEEESEDQDSDEQSEGGYAPTLWDYLNSDKGHEIAQQP